MKRVIVGCLVGLAGCSFAFQPHRTLDARQRQPSVVPIVADGLLASAAIVFGISQTAVPSSEFLSSINHTVGSIAIVAGAVTALSALYGYGRYGEKPEPDAHFDGLAEHVTIAAHAGDCGTAASVAAKLASSDPAAYGRLLADTVVQACLLRVDDDQRRFVLDAIADGPPSSTLASPAPSTSPR